MSSFSPVLVAGVIGVVSVADSNQVFVGLCPPGAPNESETCGADINGGCGSVPQVFIDAACGDLWCGTAWADGGTRDTDWYLVDLPDPDGDGVESLSVTLISEFPGLVFIVDGIGPAECSPVVVATGCADDGASILQASALLPAPDTLAVFVATGTCDGDGIFSGVPCGSGNEYTVSIKCGVQCLADLNGDGVVGMADFVELLAAWGTDPGGPPDLDGDGNVGIVDFLRLLADWGPCP